MMWQVEVRMLHLWMEWPFKRVGNDLKSVPENDNEAISYFSVGDGLKVH